jgi:hypothetical protein
VYISYENMLGGGGGCSVDSPGSGQGQMAGCCEYVDEPPGSGATDFVSQLWYVVYSFMVVKYADSHVSPSHAEIMPSNYKGYI